MRWREGPSCFHTDLSLEYLGRGDGECHKFARLLHSETICLVHPHVAECQCFRVSAASSSQAHVPFENVQHSVLFNGGGHYDLKQNAILLSIVCILMCTFMPVHILIECRFSVKQLFLNHINRVKPTENVRVFYNNWVVVYASYYSCKLPVGHKASML